MVSKLLDNDDLNRINVALERAAELQPEIDRAKLAGIDLGDREEKFIESEKKLRAVKAAFFPNA